MKEKRDIEDESILKGSPDDWISTVDRRIELHQRTCPVTDQVRLILEKQEETNALLRKVHGTSPRILYVLDNLATKAAIITLFWLVLSSLK